MNTKLYNVLKDIVEKYGESILSDPKRISALFLDLAKEVPKPPKNAFVKALEHGFVTILKNADESERDSCKQDLANKLHDEEGLDIGLCKETLDLLERVLFEEMQKKIYCQNCKKEAQEEWKTCPFCSTPFIEKEKNEFRPQVSKNTRRPPPPSTVLFGTVDYPIVSEDEQTSSFASTKKKTSRKSDISHLSFDELFNSGQKYYYLGDYDEAIEYLNEAIKAQPTYAVTYVVRGESYAKMGQYKEAIKDLNEAIRLDPSYVVAYVSRGETYAMMSQLKEAIRDLSEAIKIEPNYVYGYTGRGQIYRQLGQDNLAKKDFEKALLLDKNLSWVQQELKELRKRKIQ